MIPYTVKTGDTLERISTIRYGRPNFAAEIRAANPQVAGGLTPGTVLIIPDIAETLGPVKAQTVAGAENEMSISVDGIPFRFWTSMQLARSIDSIDTFSFTAPFEPSNEELRRVFTPFLFQRVEINIGGEPIATGTLMRPTPSFSLEGRTVRAEGYALAGVLNDCTAPSTSYPIQYKGQTLQGIAIQVMKSFGLTPTFEVDPGPVLDKVALSATLKVLPFLIKLSQQRNIFIGNDALGQPVFRRAGRTTPVASLVDGQSPVTSVTANFDSQQYFSSVTALTPETIINEGQQFTVNNTHLQGTSRPFTFRADDTFGADGPTAARARMGRMFANALSYTVGVAGWRDPSGELWQPNTSLMLLAPDAMVYNDTKFLIRQVRLLRDSESDSAILELILPGSFEGAIPEVLPWSVL